MSHGILLILPLNFTRFLPFLPTLRNLVSVKKVHIFCLFPQSVVNEKFAQRDGHGKSRNSLGEVMDKYLTKYVGTLIDTALWSTLVPSCM